MKTSVPTAKRANDNVPKGVFEELPLSIQRAIIMRAREAKATDIIYKGKEYSLPILSQITYRCTNLRCGTTRAMRVFTVDLIHSNISNTVKCHICRKRMEIILMSATLDYSLERRQKKKGILKHLSQRMKEIEDDSNG